MLIRKCGPIRRQRNASLFSYLSLRAKKNNNNTVYGGSCSICKKDVVVLTAWLATFLGASRNGVWPHNPSTLNVEGKLSQGTNGRC